MQQKDRFLKSLQGGASPSSRSRWGGDALLLSIGAADNRESEEWARWPLRFGPLGVLLGRDIPPVHSLSLSSDAPSSHLSQVTASNLTAGTAVVDYGDVSVLTTREAARLQHPPLPPPPPPVAPWRVREVRVHRPLRSGWRLLERRRGP
jgi:hypothetical protein